MNVLIVDDQPNIARVTSLAFQVLGCVPFTAANTADAAKVLASEKIDALFLDVNLGGESGFGLLSCVSAQPNPPPVVLFTALNKDEGREEAARHGVFGCLSKPYSMDDLRQLVIDIKAHLQKRTTGETSA